MDRLSKGLDIERCANGMSEWAGERIHTLMDHERLEQIYDLSELLANE